jgi:hypothetical protein
VTRELTAVEVTGEAGRVVAHVPAMPARPDDRGGYRFPYGEFGSDFFPALWEKLPLAARAGPPWRRRDVCSACGADLTGRSAAERLDVEIELGRVEPFIVELTLPAIRCSACGDIQVLESGRATEADLSEALVRGMKAIDLRP